MISKKTASIFLSTLLLFLSSTSYGAFDKEYVGNDFPMGTIHIKIPVENGEQDIVLNVIPDVAPVVDSVPPLASVENMVVDVIPVVESIPQPALVENVVVDVISVADSVPQLALVETMVIDVTPIAVIIPQLTPDEMWNNYYAQNFIEIRTTALNQAKKPSHLFKKKNFLGHEVNQFWPLAIANFNGVIYTNPLQSIDTWSSIMKIFFSRLTKILSNKKQIG